MLNKDQTQSTGNDCIPMQAAGDINFNGNISVNHGLSYKDVKEIFYDLFKVNYYELSNQANAIAEKRVQELIDKFLDELKCQNPEGLAQAINSDFQYDIFIAQREYARSGDPVLADILISLLIERTKETQRSRTQIVLNESIAVASKLTREEFDILTIWFISQHCIKQWEFHNISDLRNYIDVYILPFLGSLEKEKSWYTHLVYAGCGFIQAFQVMDIDMVIHNKSAGIIPEGFKNIFGYLVSEYPSIEPLLCIREPYFNEAIEMNMKKPESCMSLTSVGIAIGYANLCRVTGEKFNLSNWI
ncbi:LPO_1073/Vpar_1526 family protein [Methanosarcina mazei]|uniref:Uncharacterized protein n=3 Tax=Methanosarcina mazei TaxID=2209 RepID=A0A0F8DRK0_METMZ|nr:LPO_1073/Vpar_1526 family protein [Methanosarcina mazei]MDY0388072.1 hypothetical protein [Methanolobus sp.]KKF98404.1 hypothetical protein DU47_06030 [Methanosarcina mazei]KKF99913.1 hypothetical protein DU40_16100 [Methanosarcina mazei]KKG04147.1 hypothetical protein DU31_01150 [Methanosarcina mazei]KKH40328.1 hypothetical protein DU54_14240 [Methanosarcina mazei]